MAKLIVNHVGMKVRDLPPRASGLRIIHISDLHLRRWGRVEQALQDALSAIDYDLLLITGDFADSPRYHKKTAELLDRLLSPIRPSLGTYGVLGNHDSPALAEYDLPITFLRNSMRIIDVGSFDFYLAGVEQHVRYRGSLSEAIDSYPYDGLLVVMAHYPSTSFELPPGAGAIMLSGHTHGGQIRVPGLGCVFANDNIPNSMARGLHSVRGNWLHVTPGIGMSSILRLRVLCPPEISVLTLEPQEKRIPRLRTEQTRLTV